MVIDDKALDFAYRTTGVDGCSYLHFLKAYEEARTSRLAEEIPARVVRLAAKNAHSMVYATDLENRDGFIQDEYEESAQIAIMTYRDWALGKWDL